MKYLIESFNYLFRNGKGKQMLVFSIIFLLPCAMLAFFMPISRYIQWVVNFPTNPFENWGALWVGLFKQNIWGLIGVIFGFLLLICSQAVVSTIISRHVRVGYFRWQNIFECFNENFFPAAVSSAMFLLVLIVYHTILTLLWYLWSLMRATALGWALVVATGLGLSIAVVFMWSSFSLWLPVMTFNGLKGKEALTVSFYKTRNRHKGFFYPHLVIISIVVVLNIGAYFAQGIWFVSWILSTISYVFALVFIITLDFISYCDIECITREDLANMYRSHKE